MPSHMTRRHYRILASALHEARGYRHTVDTAMDAVVEALIVGLYTDNPRFDADRFRQWVATGDDGTATRYR